MAKNMKHVLIPAGRWEITGFSRRRAKCECCGRPLVNVLRLKNLDHDSIKSKDPSYSFNESIDIGTTCGPDVFKQSTMGFYEDPEREWQRQAAHWREYINYVILCAQENETWAQVPDSIRIPVDEALDSQFEQTRHSGRLWHLKSTKIDLLKTAKVYRSRQQQVPEYRSRLCRSRLTAAAIGAGIKLSLKDSEV